MTPKRAADAIGHEPAQRSGDPGARQREDPSDNHPAEYAPPDRDPTADSGSQDGAAGDLRRGQGHAEMTRREDDHRR